MMALYISTKFVLLLYILYMLKNLQDKITTYGTAQRQLDTRTHAAGWILSGEDYIMRSIFEQAPVMFAPASGQLSGVCTHEH